MECGKQFVILRRKSFNSFLYAFLPLLCKSWLCEKCRRIKATKVRAFISESFAGRPLWMLSVTYYHSGDPLDAWKNIGLTCNRLLTYARKYSGKFDYVRIVEPHADGVWPHIHILCTKPIATERFVRLLTEWGFGWNFHSVPKGSDQAADYCSKYLSKRWPVGDASLSRVISKCRIVTCSRSLGAIFSSDDIWECVSYEGDPVQSDFLCNFIISKLRYHGCSYVESKPFSSGFLIASDICLPSSLFDNPPDKFSWRYCIDFEYQFMPYGLQQEFFLE